MQDLIVVTRRALVISNPPCRFPLHRPLYNIPGTRNPSPTSIRIHSLSHPDHGTTHSTTDSQLDTAAATFAFTAFNRASRGKKNSTILLAIQSLACPYNIFPHTPYRPFPKQTWSNPISSPSSPSSPFPSLPSLPSLPSIIPIRTMASRPNQSIMPLLARQ